MLTFLITFCCCVVLTDVLQAAAAAAAAKSSGAPTIQHGQAYVSVETFQKFATDVLKSLRSLEDTAAKKK